MKKINLFLATLFVAIMGLTIVGCQKESEMDLTQKSAEITASEIYAKNGMLVFPDMETFQKTLEDIEKESVELENEVHLEISNFKSNEEKVNYLKSVNWNRNKKLEEFERDYNYISLRSVIENEITEFNKIYDPTGIEDPDAHFIGDKYLRTLLNEDCEVIIGKSIYKLLENGVTIEILNQNFEIAEKVSCDNFLDFKLNKEIIVHGETDAKTGDCQANITSTYTRINPSNENQRLKMKIIIDNWIIISARTVKAETQAQIYVNGTWVDQVIWINTTLLGNYYEGLNCDGLVKDLEDITEESIHDNGYEMVKRKISKAYRVETMMVRLYIQEVQGWNPFAWYLTF